MRHETEWVANKPFSFSFLCKHHGTFCSKLYEARTKSSTHAAATTCVQRSQLHFGGHAIVSAAIQGNNKVAALLYLSLFACAADDGVEDLTSLFYPVFEFIQVPSPVSVCTILGSWKLVTDLVAIEYLVVCEMSVVRLDPPLRRQHIIAKIVWSAGS